MTEKDILRYLSLLDRKLTIYMNSGTDWKAEYEEELLDIDNELARLRTLIDAAHYKNRDSGEKLDKILQNMDTLYERLKPVPNRDMEDFE